MVLLLVLLIGCFQVQWKGLLKLEDMRACLLCLKEGWDKVVTLATSIVDRLDLIRKEKERKRKNSTNN